MKFDLVDVFAEEALAGNQLAVVHDAGHLTTEQIQAIALETNFSETTFVMLLRNTPCTTTPSGIIRGSIIGGSRNRLAWST